MARARAPALTLEAPAQAARPRHDSPRRRRQRRRPIEKASAAAGRPVAAPSQVTAPTPALQSAKPSAAAAPDWQVAASQNQMPFLS
jgi:hypothetical protein